jgi:hypothetical protein
MNRSGVLEGLGGIITPDPSNTLRDVKTLQVNSKRNKNRVFGQKLLLPEIGFF